MAGRPFEHAFEARLAKTGGWSALFDRIAAGEKLKDIAESFGVSRSWLNTILLFRDEERANLYRTARKHAALNLAQEATEIADDVEPNKDAVSKARLQVEQRRWLAAKYDREQFGDDVAPALQVNIGDLHVQALKAVHAKHAVPNRPATPLLPSGTKET